MNMNHSSSEGQGGKKPYEKPDFRREEVFVTSALSCIKQPLESNCMFGPKKLS